MTCFCFRHCIAVWLWLLALVVGAQQNIIPNGDFDDSIYVPPSPSGNGAVWASNESPFRTVFGSADVHAYFAYPTPFNVVGMRAKTDDNTGAHYGEGIGVKLTTNLIAGERYILRYDYKRNAESAGPPGLHLLFTYINDDPANDLWGTGLPIGEEVVPDLSSLPTGYYQEVDVRYAPDSDWHTHFVSFQANEAYTGLVIYVESSAFKYSGYVIDTIKCYRFAADAGADVLAACDGDVEVGTPLVFPTPYATNVFNLFNLPIDPYALDFYLDIIANGYVTTSWSPTLGVAEPGSPTTTIDTAAFSLGQISQTYTVSHTFDWPPPFDNEPPITVSDDVTVSIARGPIDITGPSCLCPETTGTISLPGAGYTDIKWYDEISGLLLASGNDPVTVTAGIYSVTALAANGCPVGGEITIETCVLPTLGLPPIIVRCDGEPIPILNATPADPDEAGAIVGYS